MTILRLLLFGRGGAGRAARDAGFSDPRSEKRATLRLWRVSSRYRGTGREWRARVVLGSIPRARSATIELEIDTFWDRCDSWDPRFRRLGSSETPNTSLLVCVRVHLRVDSNYQHADEDT